MTVAAIGHPRIEAALKVTGAARFAAETPVEGLLHAALVTAPIAAGRVVRIDDGRARALAGVVAVLTHENTPRLERPGFLLHLQDATVRFAGQPVAVVVATTRELAALAAASVEVAYDEAPAVTSVAQAFDRAFAPPTAGHVATDSRRGDPEGALGRAEIVLERRYTTPTNNHHPIEPPAVIASWQGDALTVHATTQAVFSHRKALADLFGVPVDGVRVVARYLGGSFGAKGSAWFSCLALGTMAARQVGRPVRLELTRAQMFTLVGRRQETIQQLRLGATRQGRLIAIVHDTIAQTSTYGAYADPVATPTRMLYTCANVATTHRLVPVNAPQPNPMRAPGEGPGSFALESALDELAWALGVDPLELRRLNHADHDQHAGKPWSSNSLLACYDAASRSFGWERRPREIGALRDGHERIGWGMASACYPVYRAAAEAAVCIEADGVVKVRCGTQDMGSGTYTVLAQVAAETLGVPLADVSVELGDTALPEGPYSGGAHVTASVVPAVEEAARRLRHRLIARAIGDAKSPLHGLAADAVAIEGGRVVGVGRPAEPLGALVARAAPDGLEARAVAAPAADQRHSAYGFGAVFAEVRVDPELGVVRVSRLTAAYAAGRIIAPALARSQCIGGLVFGIGMALHEATVMDEHLGRIVNDSLADYLIPVHADMPRFDIHLVDEDDPHLAGGVKGIGMIGTVGTAAAIANAVFHATGRRIRDLPIRLEQCTGLV